MYKTSLEDITYFNFGRETWIKKLLEGLFLVLFEWSRFSLTVQYRWGTVKTGHLY